MQNLYVRKIVVRVNSLILDDFNKTTKYIHETYKNIRYYNQNAPFKHIIYQFNEEFNYYHNQYWISEIENYNSKLKKDTQVTIWVENKAFKEFMRNCNSLELNRVKVIRSIMLKLIEEYQDEREQTYLSL